MEQAAPGIAPGFDHPVFAAQAVVRAVMEAMARPGLIVGLDAACKPPAPMLPASAAVLLTLCDYESPVWLDASAAASGIADYLRFHTGAAITQSTGEAAFALVTDPARQPPLSAFNQGTPDYPDRSTTLVLQVDHIAAGGSAVLTGPGIKSSARFEASPLPPHFWAQAIENHGQFPRGVDVIFAGRGAIAALPRSTSITLQET